MHLVKVSYYIYYYVSIQLCFLWQQTEGYIPCGSDMGLVGWGHLGFFQKDFVQKCKMPKES